MIIQVSVSVDSDQHFHRGGGGGGGGGNLIIFGWGCAAGILQPLAYTRASSAELATLYLTKLPKSPLL